MNKEKDKIREELNHTWSNLDKVLEKLWKEVNGENRLYKIQRLTRSRKRLLKVEEKLLKKYCKLK